MTDQQRSPLAGDEDTEAHRLRGHHADAEQAEGDDTEAHRLRGHHADAEQAEGDDDDTGGHQWKQGGVN